MRATSLFFTLILIFSFLMNSQNASAAEGWSDCQTITGVTDYRGLTNSVIITTYPGVKDINGILCSAMGSKTGSVRVAIGRLGQTADTAKGALTLATTAYVTGKKMVFQYDNATSSCDVKIVSIGGYGAQCN